MKALLLVAILCVLLVVVYLWTAMPNPFAAPVVRRHVVRPDQPVMALDANGNPICPPEMVPMRHLTADGVWIDTCRDIARANVQP